MGNNISVTYSSNGLGTIIVSYDNETGSNATTKNVYANADKHYFIFNCSCGNNETISWNCGGSPCIMPFSVTPEYEIE